jgi:hypothetical protein
MNVKTKFHISKKATNIAGKPPGPIFKNLRPAGLFRYD